jgi:hypothetical protein
VKNTTGLYKHQRDNQGKRRKLPSADPKAKLVPVEKYEYEKAREREADSMSDADRQFDADFGHAMGLDGSD